ncbi:MAG: ATP-dependent RNA helicase DbpA [Planctomycetota bacterium]|nr:ATP-dependent RNA helicase DbpA [Planctomycetota bacterium]
MNQPPEDPKPSTDVARSGPPFSQLPLSSAALANLTRLGYHAMTPIQAASLPLALAGHDLIAQAKTGSGKTAAFALTLLFNLKLDRSGVQALVLCPTRELADQVATEIRRVARAEENLKVLTLCGGSPIRPQIASLEHGAHIVVGTPGRVMDHLQRDTLRLDALHTLVLDEADRMLDMGFYGDIVTVASQCPVDRQTLLFSATYPEGIARLARQFLRDPKEVKLLDQHAATKIRQRFYEVDEISRLQAVPRLLLHFRPVRTIAFCNTKQQCRDLVELLESEGIVALALHGDLDQRDRDQVLVQFVNKSCSVLVATDVAARGLDIERLEAVVNVDITRDPEVHVHRIGRTGRVDEDGWALSLASPRDMGNVERIEEMQGTKAEWHTLTELVPRGREPLVPPMVTLQILGGRKEKIRAGDVLGALTGEAGFDAKQIGKITVNESATYVAVDRRIGAQAVQKLSAGKVKGKTVRVRLLRPSDSRS